MALPRVGTKMDTWRAGEAMARPGMDTRTWVSLAVVNAVQITGDGGVKCDVTLMPDNQDEIAVVGTEYAGDGFGAYYPLSESDIVVVAAPSGDYNQGLVVIARIVSPTAPLPSDATSNPDDVSLTTRRGYRIRTSGGGVFQVNADGTATVHSGSSVVLDSGSVKLGGEAAAHPLVLGDTLQAAQEAFDQAAESAYTTLATTMAGPPPPDAAGIATALITFCSSMVTAQQALDLAYQTTVLSAISKTE